MVILIYPLSHTRIFPTDDTKESFKYIKQFEIESLMYTHTYENTSEPWGTFNYAWYCFSFRSVEFTI
jgi:hypothetical protein